MDSQDRVSQSAEFFRIRQEEQKERFKEHQAFRRGMAALALVAGAKTFFGRRGA
jgi:phage host-nuclease inhibitor protein Gam